MSSEWTCSACTFVNTNTDFLVCEICNSARSSGAAVWQYQDDFGNFVTYDAASQGALNAARPGSTRVKLPTGRHFVDLTRMVQVSDRGMERPIRHHSGAEAFPEIDEGEEVVAVVDEDGYDEDEEDYSPPPPKKTPKSTVHASPAPAPPSHMPATTGFPFGGFGGGFGTAAGPFSTTPFGLPSFSVPAGSDKKRKRKDEPVAPLVPISADIPTAADRANYLAILQAKENLAAPGSLEVARRSIEALFQLAEEHRRKNATTDHGPTSMDTEPDSCTVCSTPWTENAGVTTLCGHQIMCPECFHQFLQIRIRDEEVMPWIPCPSPGCKALLHPDDLANGGASVEDMLNLAAIVSEKTISRSEMWVKCKTEKCMNGFIVDEKKKERKETCELCNTKQTVKKKEVEIDKDMQKMIDEGTLKPCPKCRLWTMKEYGICNVIQCNKCSTWWNWRTSETGATQAELKERARSRGTLWEPGELAYQQKLERTDPAAFKALLARAGIEWDPHYRRGT